MHEKDDSVIGTLKGTGNYVDCAKPGYDHWSGPVALPHVYCKYYGGGNSHLEHGYCKVRLAEKYEQKIKTGGVDIHESVRDPYIYYPVNSSLGRVVAEDIRGSSAGLKPEQCVRCVQNLNEKAARRITGRVLRKLK